MLVLIWKLSLSSHRWVPMCQGFNSFSTFLHHFVWAKLATNSIRVNTYPWFETRNVTNHVTNQNQLAQTIVVCQGRRKMVIGHHVYLLSFIAWNSVNHYQLMVKTFWTKPRDLVQTTKPRDLVQTRGETVCQNDFGSNQINIYGSNQMMFLVRTRLAKTSPWVWADHVTGL